MNLLNKKLKDKLKLIDDIDKEYMLKVKNNNNNVDKNNNNMNLNEIIKNSQIQNFDKIYSNFSDEKIISFYDGSINLKYFSNSNNNFDKIPTNENSLEKEKNEYFIQKELNKEISEEKNKNNIINNNKGNESESEIKKDNVKEEKKNNDDYYNVDVVVRLMNYGNYLKQKIENERERQYLKMKQRMKPEIYQKSKSMTRNSEKATKNNINNNKNIKDNSANNNTSNISNSNPNFTYHPKINKKSLILAKKFEPSFIRLNKKKKINVEKEEDKQPKSYYLNLYGNKNKMKKSNKAQSLSLSNNNNNSNKSHNSIYEKMNELYLRGVKQKQKKEENIKEIQKKKQDEYKKYSFKPKLYKNVSYVNNNKIFKTKKSIYSKHFEWQKKVQNELNKKKVRREEFMNKLCPFKPKLFKPRNYDNDKSLSRALEQINYYINRKKENLKHKINEESYKNKKLGIDLQGYVIKSTIPKEFNLQTEKRNSDLNKNRSRSCDNFHTNQINKLIEQNSESKSLSNENDKKFWFIKDNINDINGYNLDDNSNNNKVSQPINHINYVEAVNFLHDKLNNLKI